jgi:hypothetical protein
VIQGDGISYETLGAILDAMAASGWAADNLAFGSGGALLQKLNRDTQKCVAPRASHRSLRLAPTGGWVASRRVRRVAAPLGCSALAVTRCGPLEPRADARL